MTRNKCITLLVALTLTACHPTRGFLESELKLARESRLPIWFQTLPAGYKRDDVEIYIQFYNSPFDVDDTVLLMKAGPWLTIDKKTGKSQHNPEYWEWAKKDWPARSHPAFVNVTIDGVTEVIEQKKKEPFFYMSDEETVKKRIESAK